MSNPDRRHAAGVARDVERSLGHEATRPVLAAGAAARRRQDRVGPAHLRAGDRHAVRDDVGREQAKVWTRGRGFTRRVGLYLLHPDLGGDLLGMAGSDPLTEAWTREHHMPADQWTISPELARVLKDCDDD